MDQHEFELSTINMDVLKDVVENVEAAVAGNGTEISLPSTSCLSPEANKSQFLPDDIIRKLVTPSRCKKNQRCVTSVR